jgi:hypothetical protein
MRRYWAVFAWLRRRLWLWVVGFVRVLTLGRLICRLGWWGLWGGIGGGLGEIVGVNLGLGWRVAVAAGRVAVVWMKRWPESHPTVAIFAYV